MRRRAARLGPRRVRSMSLAWATSTASGLASTPSPSVPVTRRASSTRTVPAPQNGIEDRRARAPADSVPEPAPLERSRAAAMAGCSRAEDKPSQAAPSETPRPRDRAAGCQRLGQDRRRPLGIAADSMRPGAAGWAECSPFLAQRCGCAYAARLALDATCSTLPGALRLCSGRRGWPRRRLLSALPGALRLCSGQAAGPRDVVCSARLGAAAAGRPRICRATARGRVSRESVEDGGTARYGRRYRTPCGASGKGSLM